MIEKKVRIAYVITRMDWGGSPEIVRMLCSGLSGRFEVTLVLGETLHPTEKTSWFLENFRGRVISIPRLKRDILPLSDLAALCRLYLFFRKERFDIVHTHTAKAGFLGRTAAFLAGVPCIIHTPHGHNFYGYFGRPMSRTVVLLERLAALYTRRLVMLTDLERQDYLNFRICPFSKLMLIPSALDPAFLNPSDAREETRRQLGLSGKERVVGMVARLEPVKGPEFFIEAGRLLCRSLPDVRFLVTGEGSQRKALERMVRGHGLEERFIFTGWREDIPAILSCLDVLVLPSLNEAVGLTLLQAQAAAVPVVASAVGGIAEAVKDKETGMLVDPGKPEAIEGAVKYLLENPARAHEMGQRGREWVTRNFTVEKMVARHEAMYGEMLGR